jgi:flagellar assembly protein FliH
LSNSLIKSYNVNYSNKEVKKEKRVIDSNQAVSERIKALSEILESVPEEDFADDFTEGLDAAQVDALLADQDEIAAEKERNEAAQKLIDEANEQAEEIIADANGEASRIIEEARTKAQEILEEARQQGIAEGNEKGYAEGLARAEQIEREAQEKAEELDRQYEERLEELEPKIVDALTDIYSHVFGIDLSGRSDVVLYLLKDAIRNVEGKNYLIHVSRDDHELVSANREELSAGLPNTVTLEIIEDATLPAGSSFIETDGGIFDCAIGTELELLKKELKLLSYT